jgi:hypothetical protein
MKSFKFADVFFYPSNVHEFRCALRCTYPGFFGLIVCVEVIAVFAKRLAILLVSI